MTPAIEEARRLLRLAMRDEDTFELLLPLPTAPLSAIGFHAQQAVEKSLKAACVVRGLEIRRTHDLAALAQALLDDGATLPMPPDDFRQLNPFAVQYRYDDELQSSMTLGELSMAMRRVMAWARQLT